MFKSEKSRSESNLAVSNALDLETMATFLRPYNNENDAYPF